MKSGKRATWRRAPEIALLFGLGCSPREPNTGPAPSGTTEVEPASATGSSSTTGIDPEVSGTTTTSGGDDSSSGGPVPEAGCVELTPPVLIDPEALRTRAFDSDAVLEVAAVESDLDAMTSDLLEAHSYVELNGLDVAELIDMLRPGLAPTIGTADLHLQLAQVLTRLGDMHGRIDPGPTGTLYLDVLVGDAEQCVVAFEPDRSGFVDPDHPCITAIDGVPLEDWLSTASRLATQGSPQMRRRDALRWLREIELLRRLRGAALTNTVELTLTNLDGGRSVEASRPVSTDRPTYGDWPETTTQLGDFDIAYFRVSAMDDALVPSLESDMETYRDASAWVIDVRENGGGTRGITNLFMAHLVPAADAPWVTNVAWYRDLGQGDEAVRARGLRAPADFEGDDAERIEGFVETFLPCEAFSLPGLTGPYVHAHDPGPWTFENPVVVVTDAGCGSACDVFTSALATLENVTVVGTPTSGGSGASASTQLPNSLITYRRSTMVSYQRDGNLFDGVGVRVDVSVSPSPGYFIGAEDPVLDAAFSTALSRER